MCGIFVLGRYGFTFRIALLTVRESCCSGNGSTNSSLWMQKTLIFTVWYEHTTHSKKTGDALTMPQNEIVAEFYGKI